MRELIIYEMSLFRQHTNASWYLLKCKERKIFTPNKCYGSLLALRFVWEKWANTQLLLLVIAVANCSLVYSMTAVERVWPALEPSKHAEKKYGKIKTTLVSDCWINNVSSKSSTVEHYAYVMCIWYSVITYVLILYISRVRACCVRAMRHARSFIVSEQPERAEVKEADNLFENIKLTLYLFRLYTEHQQQCGTQ